MSDETEELLAQAVAELQRANEVHPDFTSLHEAYAVILEELDEFKHIVFGRDRSSAAYHWARAEVMQVAATGIKAMMFCDAELRKMGQVPEYGMGMEESRKKRIQREHRGFFTGVDLGDEDETRLMRP